MNDTIYTTNTGQQIAIAGEPVAPTPLDPTGALATLLAVVGAVDVNDAANAVSLTADDLVTEAQAWAYAAAANA